MKRYIILFLLNVFTNSIINAQTDCKVKLESINLSYIGDCKKGYAHGYGEAKGGADSYKGNFKKGFPHGFGTYTWGKGTVYRGNFSKGKMHGKGKLVIKNGSQILKIEEGYFEDNNYIGLYRTPYKVITKREIQKVSFQEHNLNLGINYVIIKVKQAGRFIFPTLRVSDESHSPVEIINDGAKLLNVKFPLKKITVSFTHEGFSCHTVFEIYKKSDWEAIIHI